MKQRQQGFNRWYNILSDGTIYPKLLLSVDDEKKREELIAGTFLKFYESKYQIKLPQKLVERDSPHDFTFADDNITVKIEIVAITDSPESIKRQQQEKYIEARVSRYNASFLICLPLHTTKAEVERIVNEAKHAPYAGFPPDKFIQSVFLKRKAGIWKTSNVGGTRVFLTNTTSQNDLHELIVSAIQSKERKKYPHVEDIILIVDDRSIKYDREHIFRFLDPVIDYARNSPFKEIYLFSGQSMHNDQINAFTIYPIKSPVDKTLRLLEYVKARQGTLYGLILRWLLSIWAPFFKSIHRGKPH